MICELLTQQYAKGGHVRDEKKQFLQWHPAFFAGIQIELSEEAEHLVFESEHSLGTKPMQIDVLIIKKNTRERLRKNIGRIFRTHNIIEYKSPNDYLGIDDFYKVYGYTCFYKADTGKTDEIKVDELTITFVCCHYPRELIRHLKITCHKKIKKQDDGIYYISDDRFPIQLIITRDLPEETNLWLKNLTNDIQEKQTAEKLICSYSSHKNDRLYQSVMDIIIHANEKTFKEVDVMCQALEDLLTDLMKDQLDDREQKGKQLQLLALIRKKIEKGKALEVIADELEETVDSILPLYDQVKAELIGSTK